MAKSDDLLEEIRSRYEYTKTAWSDIRDEGAKDMRFVSGDPWDDDDKKQREDRPTVAPEEMGQYFNQVINQLRANPRGMHFHPSGNGATPAGARFYQNKARETEYRSHAKIAYIAAAENAIQRSYGFLRVNTRFESPRSANQEIWIEDIPDPDMVFPDPDAKRPDSSDMKFAFVLEWADQDEFTRKNGKNAKIHNFGDFSSRYPSWIQGKKVLQAEYWKIATRPRKLLLVQPPTPTMPQAARLIAPPHIPAPRPVQMFDDELAKMPRGASIIRELRTVDYPTVKMYLTNGLEILHEQDWPGKYIPIVSCYGKILYVPKDGQTERVILSMTRFGRDPWKSYCYACSQELEILGQVPKASVIAAPGQLAGFETDWQESYHKPKAYLYAHLKTTATGEQVLPFPQRLAYAQGDNLQAIEVVKEGFRRAIQSAMGSNFLPTQQQGSVDRHSGDALGKIDQAGASGTFHFVDHYDDMVRQTGIIFEDLCDKIYSQAGETGVMEADGTAEVQPINDPTNKDSVSTSGDYGVTVSSGPSSDSEQSAAADFVDTLVSNIQVISDLAGQKVASAVFAQGIRMRNLGPQGDHIADLLDPPPQDGQTPPSPQLMAAQNQVQTLTQKLQQIMQAVQAKQIEQAGKMSIAQLQEQGENLRSGYDREVKLAVAEIAAQSKQALQDMALFYEERSRLGAQIHERAMGGAELAHDAHVGRMAAQSTATENTKDRLHDVVMADRGHQHQLAQGEQSGQIAANAAEQNAALQPDPAPAQGA